MRQSLTFAALMIALAAPLAGQATGPQPEASATPTADAEKVICKQDKQTGSRVASRKTCLTARQWRERAAQAQEDLGRRTRTGNGDN